MDYSIQLYSVRDSLPKDYLGTLRAVAEMGYKKVELFGGFGPGAETLRGWLDDLGLTVSGTHTTAPALQPDVIAQTIADHKTVGCDTLIIPGHSIKNTADLDDFIAQVKRAQPILADNGIKLGFHNHSVEFYPLPDGTVIYDALRERTDMLLELDTYWAYNAGQDAVKLMGDIGSRLVAVHIKDGVPGGQGYPLGRGTAPVRAVYAKALEMGVQLTVESETCVPDGITEARECIAYLKTLEK